MHNVRLIARLDIKNDTLIKSIQLEGVRVVGDPNDAARNYYEEGADEILLMDAVASLYGRNHLAEVIRYSSEHVFLPITVGGGIRCLDDADSVLRSGADRVAINTAAVVRPGLITEVARKFGSQCMVLQVDAKRHETGWWEAYVDGGREPSGRDVLDWVREAVDRGVGEVLVTSVDREGTRKGFDTALVRGVAEAVPVPVIASGGMGSVAHLVEVVREGGADAVAMADILHLRGRSMREIKAEAAEAGVPVRQV
jgi:cyclase